MRPFLIVVLFLINISYSAAQTVTITPSKDNTLYEDTEGLTSNGAGEYLFVGQVGSGGGNKNRRAVIKFDLEGQIPAGAVITGATLKMNMSKTIVGASSIHVHRLISDWGEGTSDAQSNEGGGAGSTTNDATWKHRFFNTQNWSTLGGDFIPDTSATLSVGSAGVYEWTDVLMWADVVSWHSSPASNFGWILIGKETGQSSKRFDSRNNATSANRPKLIVEYMIVNSVREISSSPESFSLQQNYPNPFNPSTTIRYSIPAAGHVSLKVFDLLGKEIATLVNETKTAGSFSQEWDASVLPSGMYFYRLQSGNNVSTKKLLLTK